MLGYYATQLATESVRGLGILQHCLILGYNAKQPVAKSARGLENHYLYLTL